jgi:ATP-dependent RNA helicase RhlE
LEDILHEYKGSVLVFVRTKHGATKLTKALVDAGHMATEIHSNLSFNQRKTSLAGFKSGYFRIMVATDVAARGLDINDIQLVLNYDLPDNSEDYVHRIGRTARAGKEGKAISFAAPSQRRDIQKIERLIKKDLPIKELPGFKGFRTIEPVKGNMRSYPSEPKKVFTRPKRRFTDAPARSEKKRHYNGFDLGEVSSEFQNKKKRRGPGDFPKRRKSKI